MGSRESIGRGRECKAADRRAVPMRGWPYRKMRGTPFLRNVSHSGPLDFKIRNSERYTCETVLYVQAFVTVYLTTC